MNRTFIAYAFVLTFILLTPCLGEEPAAWVDSLHGAKKLQKHLKGDPEDSWYLAHIEMTGQVLDGFRTDKNSLASLRFFLGARANLDKGSRIRIVSNRNVVFLEKGSLWTRFQPGGNKEPVTIQTAGGVMAIKGTEFVVRVQGEGDATKTEVSVLSGTVEVTPAELSTPTSAGPGTTVTFDRYGITDIVNRIYSQEMAYLKANYASLFEIKDLLEQTREAAQLLRYQKVRLTTEEKKFDNEKRRTHYLLTGKDIGAGETGSAETSNIDALLAEFDAKMEGKQGAPEGGSSANSDLTALLNGETPNMTPKKLSFDWDWMEGDLFGFLILDAQDDDRVFWVDRLRTKSFVYPEGARPLEPGDYRFRVVPINDVGKPVGRPSEFAFSVSQ